MAMRRRLKTRAIMTPVILLSVLLVSGIVYAASTGNLTFTGTVGRNSNCNLNIEAATNVNPNSTTLYQPNSTVTVSVDATTRETLSFSTDLTFKDPAKTIAFQIQSVGNCIQVLGNLSITGTPGNGVIVTWPNLNGMVLEPGTSSGPLIITVQWTTVSAATTTETMAATISYTEQ